MEEGEVFTGKVLRTLESGAIVELPGNKDGMVHISELEHYRVDKVEDILKVGDIVTVKVVEVDKARGRIRLSRKALLPRPEGGAPAGGGEGGGGGRERSDRGDRGDRGGDRDRGDRGGDRGDRGPRPPRNSEPSGGAMARRRPRPPRDREK